MFGSAKKTAAAWANPGSRPEILPEDNTLLVFPGTPSERRGAFQLNATVGSAPLTSGQTYVIDALIRAGAWASIESVPDAYRAEVPGMLDAGLLYGFSLADGGFYRDDLVPVQLTEAPTPFPVPSELFDFIDVVAPRGNGTASVPALALCVLNELALMWHADAESVGVLVVGGFVTELQEAGDHGGIEKAEAAEIKNLCRLSIILLAQAGLIGLDIRRIGRRYGRQPNGHSAATASR